MSAEQKPTLINKNIIRGEVATSPLSADEVDLNNQQDKLFRNSVQLGEKELDKVIKKINKDINRRRIFGSGFFKAALFLITLVIFFALGLSLFYRKPGPNYLEPSNAQPEASFEKYQLNTPPTFLSQISDVDLTQVDAISVYAFNPATYQVYVENNSEEKRKIASLTKLMTAAVLLEAYDTDTVFEMKEPFVDEVSNGIGLEIGDKLRFEDAFAALLIGSHNDVAMLVAQNHPHGYDAFIDQMNKKAQTLGMFDTSFSNSTGYDHINNYSTAKDLKKLAIYSLKSEKIMETVKIPRQNISVVKSNGTVEEFKLETTNLLLGSSPVIKGLKTGYTADAGQCFIGYFEGEGDDKLITIILGASEDRFEETLDLFDSLNIAFSDV